MIELQSNALPTIKRNFLDFRLVHWVEMLPQYPESWIGSTELNSLNLVNVAAAWRLIRLKVRVIILLLFRIIFFLHFQLSEKVELSFPSFIDYLRVGLFNIFNSLNRNSVYNIYVFSTFIELYEHVVACEILNFFIEGIVILESSQSIIN